VVTGPASQPVARQAPVSKGPRDLLVASAAAALLLVGLLALPATLRSTAAPTAMADAAPAAPAKAETPLVVTDMLRLPGGLAFEMTETPTAIETIVSAVPEDLVGSVAVGDVLLVYRPTGETLATASALRDVLTREFADGVTTYSFVIRRGASTMNAEFRLGVAG
jgi:hypothetical protein